LQLQKAGYNPLLLNMSDIEVPGGAVDAGSGAQEENLFRRSNYFLHLTERFYPLKGKQAVYSKDVLVFKTDDHSGYQLMKQPRPISMIAIPAIRFPNLPMSFENINLMKDKIRMIFNVAHYQNHDSLVLSAFGCGAYGNPPRVIATLFKEVIEEYNQSFNIIAFAIIKDKSWTAAQDQNFKIFERVLL